MSSVSAAGAASAGESQVVLVRPRSPCDTGDYTVVVDDRGGFVANVAPGTRAAITFPPGMHILYAWSSRDVRYDKEPNFDPVAATRVTTAAGETKYVALRVVMREVAINRCYRYAPVVLRHLQAGEEAAEEIAATQPLAADRAAGQAELGRDAARLKEHLAFGEERLRRNDAARSAAQHDTGE
jgi:hypothetical protein